MVGFPIGRIGFTPIEANSRCYCQFEVIGTDKSIFGHYLQGQYNVCYFKFFRASEAGVLDKAILFHIIHSSKTPATPMDRCLLKLFSTKRLAS